jgi:hypothetical protein
MTSRRALLVLALMLPAALHAQRRRVTVRDELPPDLTTKDIERLSPARIALEREKELLLATDQKTRLDSLGKSYSARLKDFSRPLDTLQTILDKYHKEVVRREVDRFTSGPRRDPTTDAEREQRAREDSVDRAKADRSREAALSARNELDRILLIIRDDYDAQTAATNSVLDDAQRAKLGPIITAASDELTSRLHWARARWPG